MLIAAMQRDSWEMRKYVSRSHYDILIANTRGKSQPIFRDYLLHKKYKDIIAQSSLMINMILLYQTFLVMFSKSSDYIKTLTCSSSDGWSESANFHPRGSKTKWETHIAHNLKYWSCHF